VKTQRTLTLDGTSLLIRPIGADDRALLARMFDRLSLDSRRARFRGRDDVLTEEDLDYLTDVDEYRHDALVAIDAATHEAVGVARYVRLPGRRELAEVAVEVVDDWQRRGVATALLVELTARARAAGVTEYNALVSPDNAVMLDVLERLGAEFIREADDGAEYSIDLASEAVEERLRRPIESRSRAPRRQTIRRRASGCGCRRQVWPPLVQGAGRPRAWPRAGARARRGRPVLQLRVPRGT
jgi:RimJ/RimL family protein N-acetyltransferase